jgi:hypothetical protein
MIVFVLSQVVLSIGVFLALKRYIKARTAEITTSLNAIVDIAYEAEDKATRALVEVGRVAADARNDIQNAIVKSFSAPVMAEWRSAAEIVAKADSLHEVAVASVPALKDMKPGGLSL